MQIRYDSTAGLTNVGYRILNADKTEYAALTTTGVTEVSPGGYGVTVADDVLAGRTVEWYEGATYSVAESFPAGVAQTGDAFARLGAPTGASIAADIANLTGVVTEGVPHIYAPTSATRVIGDDEGGTVANLVAADDTYFVTGEVVGTGLEVIVTLATSTVGDIPAGVELFGRYSGGSGHLIYVYQYDYQAGAWETSPGITMSNRTGDFAYVVGATAVNHNPTTGEMKLRLIHSVGTYNSSHALYLNRVAWTKVEASDPSAVQIAAILSLVSAFDTVDFPAVQGVVDTLAARLTAIRAGNLDNLDAAITSRLAAAGYTAPDNASAAAAAASAAAVDGRLPIDPADASVIAASFAAVPAAVDATLSAAHGAGAWGAAVPGWSVVTSSDPGQSICEDDDGNPLGNVSIVAYLASDVDRLNPISSASSEVDGEWTIYLPPSATYDLLFQLAGQEPVVVQVTV